MIIPHDLAQETVRMFLANEYPPETVKTQEQPVLCESGASYDVTAWPVDAPRPPFAVGGVYTFADVYGRQRTALVYTEQWSRVGSAWWHVSQVPDEAALVGTFTPDAAMIADARRVAREVENSERWS